MRSQTIVPQVDGSWDVGDADTNGDVSCYNWGSAAGDPVGVYTVILTNTRTQESYTATFEVLGAEFVPEPGVDSAPRQRVDGIGGIRDLAVEDERVSH